MDLFNSGDARVRLAEQKDVAEIATNMRQSDIEEVWASNHLTPQEAMQKGFKNSTICLTVELADRAVAMFGVVPFTFLGNEGSVWMLASNNFCKVNKKFLRRCRTFVKLMLSYYPHLFNYVDVRNRESIRWLKWCGAKLSLAIPYGIDKMPFHYFEFRR